MRQTVIGIVVMAALSASCSSGGESDVRDSAWAARMQAAVDTPLRPDKTVMDHIERKARRDYPCAKAMGPWERHYTFKIEDQKLDAGVIEFSFHEAGFAEFRDRRIAMSPGEFWSLLDHRIYRNARGSYDLRTDKLVFYCSDPKALGITVGPA